MIGLEKYRLSIGVREGLELELPDAPGAKFRVRLPSKYNREWTRAQQAAVKMKLGADGKVDFAAVDPLAFQDARLEAFLTHCVLEVPPPLTRELLLGEYRPGLEALLELASELADAEDAEAQAATKKNRKSPRLAN